MRYIIEYEVSNKNGTCLSTYAGEEADSREKAVDQFMKKHPDRVIVSVRDKSDEDCYGLGSMTDEEVSDYYEKMNERYEEEKEKCKEAEQKLSVFDFEELIAWAKYEEARKEPTKNVDGYSVGDILVNSWGYDMTVIDFYQIVSLKGSHYVNIRSINQKSEFTGFMSGICRPVRDDFSEKDQKEYCVKTSPYGVNVPESKGRIMQRWTGKFESFDHAD